MVYRKCTRHHRCVLREISKSGEINSTLPDLHNLFLALVLIILALGECICKVARAPTLETAVFVVRARCLLYIRPWAGLLLLLLLWNIASLLLLLLWWSDDPTP